MPLLISTIRYIQRPRINMFNSFFFLTTNSFFLLWSNHLSIK
ncbi:unnamed protein product [Brassica oleracea var. botrytis]